MLRLHIIFMLVHQGYSMISVMTAQYGEAVTFKCLLPTYENNNSRIKWYKQSVGDTLTLITTLMTNTIEPAFEKGFSPSRFSAKCTTGVCTLTIAKTEPEDEALYHCGTFSWRSDRWTGTYLSLKENDKRARKYTVVQWPGISESVQPGKNMTLQCSIHRHSEDSSCPHEHRVHWFAVRSDQSLGNVIYTSGNGPHKSECKPESKSCVYHFSKNISSSDDGTYYCAVATCGEILFGDGTKLDIQSTKLVSEVFQMGNQITFLFFAVLATCVPVILIMKKNTWDSCNALFLRESVEERNVRKEENKWIYSTAVFEVIKTSEKLKRK
ncbi:uncharacterized protein ACNS7B_012167 [Menidia menidia]